MSNALKISYLGPAGSHTHQAILKLRQRPDCAFLKDYDLVPLPTFRQQMEAMERGDVHLAVLPTENTLEGAIVEVMESTGLQTYPLQPLCEFLMPVNHCLIHPGQVSMQDIKTLVSHPIALAQCQKSILKHWGEDVQMVPVTSTSEAVRLLREPGHESWAAIGTAEAASLYGMTVLQEDFSESGITNLTRFMLAGNADRMPEFPLKGEYPMKTSVCVGIKDRPGGLVDLLLIFKDYGINMTRIESRPSKKKFGDYIFYIDLEIDLKAHDHKAIMRFLQSGTTYLHVLEPYPSLGLLK